MPNESWSLPAALSDRPRIDALARFLQRVLHEKGDLVEFVVLYGSMAKGTWGLGSDYDLLIGIRGPDDRRITERYYEYSRLGRGGIEPMVYPLDEIEQMVQDYHLTILEACDHGIVLYDRGTWARVKRQFQQWRREGRIERWKYGWRIHEQPAPQLAEAPGPSEPSSIADPHRSRLL